ncbi:MAG: CpsB/CapC family capsule biosynthesis tyrosine phosphatase [Ferruginibacter sp.]
MFSLFKNKTPRSKEDSYFPITTDIHSHILPGIDDGSPNIETSIELVKGLMELGITRSIATPHIISDMFRNDAASIGRALDELNAELKVQNLEFEVTAAAEYMMDAYFFELLQRKVKLLPITGNIILTEFSYATLPHSPEQMSFAIITEGYTPILAHPERYPYYYHDHNMYHHLQDLGFLLQINLLSLSGYYGKEAARAANYMLKNGLVSYVGTDLHHDRHLAGLKEAVRKDVFKKALVDKEWNVFSSDIK